MASGKIYCLFQRMAITPLPSLPVLPMMAVMMVMVAMAMMMVMMPHSPTAETAKGMMMVMAPTREQRANGRQYNNENDETEHCYSPSAESPALISP